MSFYLFPLFFRNSTSSPKKQIKNSMISLIFVLHLCFNYFSIIFNDNGGNSMTENYYLISDQDMHMPIRCSMQRFDHIRQQMHDFFEISMIVSGNCTLQLEDHMYSLSADDVFCVNPLTLHELHGVNCVIVTIYSTRLCLSRIFRFPPILVFSVSAQ